MTSTVCGMHFSQACARVRHLLLKKTQPQRQEPSQAAPPPTCPVCGVHLLHAGQGRNEHHNLGHPPPQQWGDGQVVCRATVGKRDLCRCEVERAPVPACGATAKRVGFASSDSGGLDGRTMPLDDTSVGRGAHAACWGSEKDSPKKACRTHLRTSVPASVRPKSLEGWKPFVMKLLLMPTTTFSGAK